MAHPHELYGVGIISLVAAISLVLTVLAFAAWRRSDNRKLGFVTAAFFVFFAKSLLTAYAVETNAIVHEDLELVGALADLFVVVLLLAPFGGSFVRRRP